MGCSRRRSRGRASASSSLAVGQRGRENPPRPQGRERRGFSLLAFPATASESASYGGQAVIEGVMIRGPRSLSVAVRRADGRIVLKREPIVPLTRRHRLFGLPLIRGAFALVDALVTGIRALSFSADVAMEEETERLERERQGEELPAEASGVAGNGQAAGPAPRVEVREAGSDRAVPFWPLVLTLAAGFAIAVVVFVMLPDAAANLLRAHLPGGPVAHVAVNLLEGLMRIALFTGYILVISRMETIRRVFEYHGAEHQVIYAFENGGPVTPDVAASYDTAHPRCGTSFLAVVIVVSILAFSLLDIDVWYLRQGAKLLLLPLVGGISYEVIRLAGAGKARFLVAPGLWLQRLTTRRPDAGQVEVAIAALEGALALEGRTLNQEGVA